MAKFRSYIDTSVYLGLLLDPNSLQNMEKIVDHSLFISSALLFIEAERNLIRLAREKKLKEIHYKKAIKQIKEDSELFILRDLSIDLCLTGNYPALTTPRSLDLIHLRTALWFHQQENLDYFLTLDKKLALSAEELNLPIFL